MRIQKRLQRFLCNSQHNTQTLSKVKPSVFFRRQNSFKMALFHPIITPSIGVYLLSCLHPAYEKSRELVRARKKYYGQRGMSCLNSASRDKTCDFCAKKGTPYCCPRCKSALYCSREHLKSDWKLHKRKCPGYTESGNQPAVTDRISLRDNGFIGLGANPYSSDPYHVNRTMKESQSELADFVVNSLYLTGHCIVDNFNGNTLALEILEEMKTLSNRGCLESGQLACSKKNLSQPTDQKIRGDKIAWIDSEDDNCQATARHVSAVDALIYLCNELIPEHDIRNRTKAMMACYPGNEAAYKRHVDNYNKDGRCLTTLYYLNKSWNSEENGGLLRMYPEGSESVDIEPILDRLLIFWSDRRNPHEVLPTKCSRFAITIWYFDTDEREQYLAKNNPLMNSNAIQQRNNTQLQGSSDVLSVRKQWKNS